MEWTEAHDLILAKEVRASEPWIFKPRTVDRGKVWNAITDHLNDETSVKFQVKKKQVQEHFKLLLDKFKAKRKHQAKLSGVDIEDSEMDILMEEISEKWEESEASDLGCTSKEKADSDRAIGEEIMHGSILPVTIPPSPSGPGVGNCLKRFCSGGRGAGQIENNFSVIL